MKYKVGGKVKISSRFRDKYPMCESHGIVGGVPGLGYSVKCTDGGLWLIPEDDIEGYWFDVGDWVESNHCGIFKVIGVGDGWVHAQKDDDSIYALSSCYLKPAEKLKRIVVSTPKGWNEFKGMNIHYDKQFTGEKKMKSKNEIAKIDVPKTKAEKEACALGVQEAIDDNMDKAQEYYKSATNDFIQTYREYTELKAKVKYLKKALNLTKNDIENLI
jgi:hypothetical protein